jgi:hypothetical protein
MKKLYFLMMATFASQSIFSQFDFYATAVYVSANGNANFYNTTAPGNGQDIGSTPFQGASLGTFGKNSGNLVVTGGEVKTFKSANGNVCSAILFFTVYPVGQRPLSPAYTSIGLGFYSGCTDPACGGFPNSFPLAKGGGCCNPLDQKWQFPGGGNGGDNDGNADLTNQEPGEYILEVYYRVTGQENGNGCSESRYDNNALAPSNYTATFTIAASLPVKFGSIIALKTKDGNNVSWSTLSEQNAAVFIIERSADGRLFIPVGSVPAAKNATGMKKYYFTDTHPLEGLNYYRVKMLEPSGKSYYSAVAVATANNDFNTRLYPNPAKNNVTIYSPSPGSIIRIYNASGAIVYHAVSSGQLHVVNVSGLISGRYQVKVTSGSVVNSLPLIVAR